MPGGGGAWAHSALYVILQKRVRVTQHARIGRGCHPEQAQSTRLDKYGFRGNRKSRAEERAQEVDPSLATVMN